jgi:hypothetical protein
MQAIHYLGNFKIQNLHTQIQQDYRIMIVILVQKQDYRIMIVILVQKLHTQIQQDYRIMNVILVQKLTHTNTTRLQNYDCNLGTKTYTQIQQDYRIIIVIFVHVLYFCTCCLETRKIILNFYYRTNRF